MIPATRTIAFVGAQDIAAAEEFYVGKLGFHLVGKEPSALVLDAAGTMLRITGIDSYEPPPYTVLGWVVVDIEGAVRDLTAKGIEFGRFPGLEQTADGVWQADNGDRVAWFRDPAGNVVSITEFA